MSSYGKYFQEDLVKAIQSLEVFPQVIKEFREFLKQRYLKKHKPSELVWIDRICGEYEDNCKHYAIFIRRVVAAQFLAKCLHVKEGEIGKLISELKANINAVNKRLTNFLGETDRKQVVEKLDGELARMENAQQKKNKKEKYMLKFSEWVKGKVLEQVGDIFAKVVGPLWELVYTNASMAIQSDYDHEVLTTAIEKIHGDMPKMEESLELNRRAFKGIGDVLDVFGQKDANVAKEMLSLLYPIQNDISNACDRIIELVKDLDNE